MTGDQKAGEARIAEANAVSSSGGSDHVFSIDLVRRRYRADVMIRSVGDMSREIASNLAEAAELHAAGIGITIAVSIVDRGGHLVLAVRMDGTALCAMPIAANKAETAVLTGALTAVSFAATQPGEPDWGFNSVLAGRYTCMPGGLPVISADEVIGGIGISGGQPAQDIDCALAALARLAELGVK